jgi:undecaprenyl-diphosphatase
VSFLVVLVLAVLQGLTEFLPVSSSGHLVVAQHYLSGFTAPPVPFDVMLHGGTLVSLVLYFFKDIRSITVSFFGGRGDEWKESRRLGLMIIVGCIPTAIIGLAFQDLFERLFETVKIVPYMFLITSLLLLVAEKRGKTGHRRDHVGLKEALIIGIVQGCAIIPGISRSGSTIACGMLLGIRSDTAARYSFLLSIPAVFGAVLLNAKELLDGNIYYAVGAIVAAVVGLGAIKITMNAVVFKKLWIFALYLIFVGTILLGIHLFI